MPSLKIDIIVDDKGRPVIDKTSASMRDLASATGKADAAMQKKTSSAASLYSTALKLAGAYYAVRQSVEAVTSLLMQGVKAIDDYNLSIAKMAAMMTGMTEPNGKSLADQYRDAYGYAGKLNVMIEQVDKNTLLTAKDLRQITEEMLKQGVVVDTNNQKQVEAFTSISNALAVIAQGAPNKEIQYRQEIRALLSGQMRDTDQLSKMLNAQTGDLKEQLKIHREQGDLIEWLGEQLRGFAAAQGDINASWEASKTSLQTIYEQILRDSFKAVFIDINKSAKELSKWAIDHKAEIADVVDKGYKAIRDVVKDIIGIAKPWKDELREVLGIVKEIAEGTAMAIRMMRLSSAGMKEGMALGYGPASPFYAGAYAYDKLMAEEQQKHQKAVFDLARQGGSARDTASGGVPKLKVVSEPDKAAKQIKKAKEEIDELIKTIDKGEQAMMKAWEGHGGGMGADGIWQSVDAWKEAAKELLAYEQLMANFDDEFATATANAQNELDALLTKEKSFIKDSKSEFDQLKDVIDGWGKDSADAIAKFCTGAETDFGDMIQSMIQDLMKMMIYENITGPLFRQISGGSFLSGLFGGGGASMGHGDWTAGLGFHGGGVPAYDSPAFTRTVPGAVFANAPRFHSGIGPGERAAIIRNDEGVFTPGQMKALGKGKSGNTVIVHLENPVFQDLETQNRTMAQIAEIVAKKVAPGAVVENYKNDGEIRAMVKGRT